MGAEATCELTLNGKTTRVKARLETSVLQLRGAGLKLDLPFKDITEVAAGDGALSVNYGGGTIVLRLGAAAAKWADKILRPPSRLSKLGVKPGWRVSTLGRPEPEFLEEIEPAVTTLSAGRVVKQSDAIFFFVSRATDLRRVAGFTPFLTPDGALWIVRPKGHPEITERGVMAAGRAAGLVDVKVVAFSPTHTAEKFVIPVKDRQRSGRQRLTTKARSTRNSSFSKGSS